MPCSEPQTLYLPYYICENTYLYYISTVSCLSYFLRTISCNHAETVRSHHGCNYLGVGAAGEQTSLFICGADLKWLNFSI